MRVIKDKSQDQNLDQDHKEENQMREKVERIIKKVIEIMMIMIQEEMIESKAKNPKIKKILVETVEEEIHQIPLDHLIDKLNQIKR
jgi:Mor family transcriptional regulator